MPDSSLKYCLSAKGADPWRLSAKALRLLFILQLATALVGAVDLSSIPKPKGYVSDLANVLTPTDKDQLEVFCQKVEHQLNAQFAIVTIKSLNGEPIENFSLDLARKWGVGPKGKDQGLLLLLVIQDRKQRIEVGRGLEPEITAGFAGDTLRDMRPLLRAGDYGGALKQSTLALAARIAERENISFSETLPVPPRPEPQVEGGGRSVFPLPLILFIVVFVFIFFLNARRGGGGRGGGGGFWTGVLLSSRLNSGRGGRGGGGGGGSWGGGGGFGGDSGGGGGFGGFGGGDFGGGGASSDW